MPLDPDTRAAHTRTVRTVVLDFETRSRVELSDAGAWRYAQDPSTDVICLAWQIDDGPMEAWVPDEFFSDTSLYAAVIAGDTVFVAHNAGFEKAIWRHIMEPRYGAPPVPNSLWHDTMAMCAMRAIPQKLERCCPVLRLKNIKDAEGNRLIKKLCKPDKKTGEFPPLAGSMQRVLAYCADDVHAQWGLHRRLGWLPDGERDVWLLDQRINERGFRVDMPLVRNMQTIIGQATDPLAAEFRELTAGLDFTQMAKIKDWCHGEGFHIDNLQAETIAVALGHSPDFADDDLLVVEPEWMPDNVRRALEIRQLIGSASIKKLHKAEACVMEDGRARGGLQYHAASPGRWGGRLIQPHNFPRGTMGEYSVDALVAALMTGDATYVEALIGPAVETCVSSLRHIITCNPGRSLVAGDFSTVEARITLALAGQDDKVAMLAAGLDPYCDMATSIYKRPVIKADMVERQTGKNSVLGLGFGMGAPKFMLKYDARQGQPLEFYQGVVDTYRKEWAPEVPKLWRGLMSAATRAVWGDGPQEAYGIRYAREDMWLTATYHDGSKVWYFNPQPIREAMPWDATDVRRGWSFQALKMNKWVTTKAFGGLLMQNTAEHLARQLLVSAMFKCEAEAIPVILTVHDEIVGEPEAKRQDSVTILKQIMEDIPDWARHGIGVPVKAECWQGDRYRK